MAALLLPGGSVSRLGGAMALGVGAAVPWWDRLTWRRGAAELGGLCLAGGGLAAAALLLGREAPTAVAAGSLMTATLFVVWGWSVPLRQLGAVSLGRLVSLGGFAACAGTPFLLVESPVILPAWVTEWNPLARLAGSILGRDWFHGPTLYGRVGEAWYRYPSGIEGAAGPLLSAAAALAVGLAFGRLRRIARETP